MKKILRFFGIFVGIGMCSCNLSSIDTPVVIAEVDEEFNLEIREELSSGENSFVLEIESIKQKGCLNYSIDKFYVQQGNKLNVFINDIIQPLDCVAGEAPAKTFIDLGQVGSGIFNLRIDLKKTLFNEGQIIINDDDFSVLMRSENGIKFRHSKVLRVPKNYVWGYIQFKQENQELSRDFFTELETEARKINPEQGYYHYFEIDKNNLVSVKGQPDEGVIQSFIYSGPDNHLAFQAILEKYRAFEMVEKIFVQNGTGKLF